MSAGGTPATLREAIINGLSAATAKTPSGWTEAQRAKFEALPLEAQKLAMGELQDHQLRTIELHILDFLRQRFGVAYLEADVFDPAVDPSDFPLHIVRKLAQLIGVE